MIEAIAIDAHRHRFIPAFCSPGSFGSPIFRLAGKLANCDLAARR
jgi:hypothetical protein